MIKNIITKENLIEQARILKSGGFKPGFDKMSADAAVIQLELNGEVLCKRILAGKYEPMPELSFHVARRTGKTRTLSKLSAMDMVIQKAVLNGVYDKVDAQLSPNSFAYRKNRGITDAVELYKKLAADNRYVAKIDPVSCFDNMDHGVLEACIKEYIDDSKLVSLIMTFVNAPVAVDGTVMRREKGIAQGAPLSPLLCNLYLNSLDGIISNMGLDFIRYADDIVVFSDGLDVLENCVDCLNRHLENNLKLTLNKSKFRIGSPFETEFLGHKFAPTKFGITADENEPEKVFSNEWVKKTPADNKRTVDIVSNGILSQKGFSLVFDNGETEADIPVKETGVINIYSNVVFDSGVMKKAFANGIVINIFSENGTRIGRFIPDSPLKSPSVTIEQLEAYYDPDKRIKLVKSFLLASFHNTRLVIRYYNKHNPSEEYKQALNKINNIFTKIKDETDYEKLLLLEAKGREAYYTCFDSFVAESGFSFDGRSRRPPENEINSMLSFGNTLLYNFIATEINKTPLDIRIGFLHAANRRAESLNLDIAELFKPIIVDRTVFTLINKREISPEDFRTDKNGVYLNEKGKRIFLERFYEKLDTTLQIKDTSMSYRSIITEEIRKLIRLFRSGEEYKAFRQVR